MNSSNQFPDCHYICNSYQRLNMRLLTLLFSLFISANALAYDHSYSVSGEDEDGQPMEGTIYSENGERSVTGELTDDNGDSHDINGQWEGYRHITAETEEGSTVDLQTDE
jgi:hypothetical protein